ncbi:MAG: hypothetical protein ACWGQW_09305 [bacterium]
MPFYSNVVYGRNIHQRQNPALITRAFMAMIHKDVTVEEAWDIYQTRSVA